MKLDDWLAARAQVFAASDMRTALRMIQAAVAHDRSEDYWREGTCEDVMQSVLDAEETKS